MKRNAKANVDVAVLGGGPAGTATALALRQRGLSVAVIEKSSYDGIRIGETLPPRIQPLLVKLGVWDQFLADNHLPAPGIRSAWGQEALYDNDFIFNPYGSGWHVDRARFDSMLAKCAEDAGATIYRKASPLSSDQNGSWQLELTVGSISAAFIVDATGRSSSFAQKQAIRRITYDRLIGVIAFGTRKTSDDDSPGFTLIEAVENGWWYSTILPGSRAVVAYITDSDLYGKAQKNDSNYWRQLLQQTVHVQSSIKAYEMDDDNHIVPANTSRLERIAGKNWLAVGDAAMAFDPLSGQGVYKALQWALKAAEAIAQDLSGYEAAMIHDFDEYRRIRENFYAKEQRWPESSFWKRRHQIATPVSPASP